MVLESEGGSELSRSHTTRVYFIVRVECDWIGRVCFDVDGKRHQSNNRQHQATSGNIRQHLEYLEEFASCRLPNEHGPSLQSSGHPGCRLCAVVVVNSSIVVPIFGGSELRLGAPIGAPNCSYWPPRTSAATRPFVPCVGTTALPSCRLHRSCFVFSAQSGLRSGPCVASTSAPNFHILSRL